MSRVGDLVPGFTKAPTLLLHDSPYAVFLTDVMTLSRVGHSFSSFTAIFKTILVYPAIWIHQTTQVL